jgi:hypothetical protein
MEKIYLALEFDDKGRYRELLCLEREEFAQGLQECGIALPASFGCGNGAPDEVIAKLPSGTLYAACLQFDFWYDIYFHMDEELWIIQTIFRRFHEDAPNEYWKHLEVKKCPSKQRDQWTGNFFREKMNDTHNFATTYYEIGNHYRKSHHSDSRICAMEHYEKAIELHLDSKSVCKIMGWLNSFMEISPEVHGSYQGLRRTLEKHGYYKESNMSAEAAFYDLDEDDIAYYREEQAKTNRIVAAKNVYGEVFLRKEMTFDESLQKHGIDEDFFYENFLYPHLFDYMNKTYDEVKAETISEEDFNLYHNCKSKYEVCQVCGDIKRGRIKSEDIFSRIRTGKILLADLDSDYKVHLLHELIENPDKYYIPEDFRQQLIAELNPHT